ncbi:hypothetical protein FJ692_28625 [Pseudomonas fluorescens]|nr:hypothetical protein C1751_12025 [Pseudomonas fluorescens]PRW81224.1 hypothetical protein C7A12_00695 [Pseudomonas fluorescens]PRW82475.1 hypothetical protein C7A13_00695 [Pseudomonas fluorescens]TPV49506.1 hypothetical protein FJ692_28625 [Pseudomonas fluorescens]
MWERACSRIRCNSRQVCSMTHRFREQTRSHILIEVAVELNPVIAATFNPEEQECHDVDIFSS